MALAEFKAKPTTGKTAGSSESNVAPVLDTEHFKLLATASAQFSEYLRVTHGEEEEDIARLDQTRAVRGFKPTAKARDFSDEDEDEDSSLSEQSESDPDEDTNMEPEVSDESEPGDSDEEKKTKKKKKASKDQKSKTKSSKSVKKDKRDGKAKKKSSQYS